MDTLHLFDAVAQPVFFIRNGTVAYCNRAAAASFMQVGDRAEDYVPELPASDGLLSVSVRLGGKTMRAQVHPVLDGRLFLVSPEQTGERPSAALARAAQAIRAPLSTMLAASESLLPFLQYAEDPAVRQMAAALYQSYYQLLRVSGAISLSAQADSGTLRLQAERTELCAFLEALASRAAPLIREAGRTLLVRTPSAPLYAEIDRQLLQKAILTVISNAVKFSPEQGEIRLRLSREKNTAVVRIEDDGEGMDAGALSSAFSHFARPELLDDPRWGAGFGLTLAEQLVQLHGGRMLLQTGRNHGTVVVCELPLHQPTVPGELRSPTFAQDYSGGLSQELIELADVLPASVFDPSGF